MLASACHGARRQWCVAALAALAALVAVTAASTAAAETVVVAPRPPTRNVQKRAAEQEREQLQKKLTILKRAIDATETEKIRAADALARSESAISDASRALRELSGEQVETQARLTSLSQQLQERSATLAVRRKQLASLVREQYKTGSEDRTRLLLSGEDPARIGRSLRYLGYVSQAQAQLIAALRLDLQQIETDQAAARTVGAELEDIATESAAQKTRLQQEQAQRAQLMASLAGRLSSQRAEAGRLQRDEGRLGGLVEELGKLIAQQQKEQQKAQALARERRRQEEIAAAIAVTRKKQVENRRRERLAASKVPARATRPATATARVGNPDAIDADDAPATENTKVLSRNELIPESSVLGVTSLPPFQSLKGQLRLPLRGDVTGRFGARRNDGPNTKGLFIRAAEGTQVHAVAAGRVVFAEWLRGFGNLIIVDHGSQFLTIYGNNQAVLRHAGDNVRMGDVIASAGNTGGNEQSGLYFEMRYQGRAFDPLGWVTSR